MSDRINGFVVILDKDYKDEDVEQTINAIRQIKGVISVKPNIVKITDSIGIQRTKIEISHKLYDFIGQILGE